MLVVGAKNFAKEVLVVLDQCHQLEDLVFYDDVSDDLPETLYGFRIITNESEASEYLKNSDGQFILGLANPHHRRILYNKFVTMGGKPAQLISPFAKIGNIDIQLGDGNIIMTDCILTIEIKLGKGCLINKSTIIGHGVTIGDFVEISPGVQISGNCSIGNNTSIGARTTIIPKIKIGSNVIIAAGSVVTKDVPDNCMIAGVPAVIKKYLEPKNN